jgi:hypothetical protein
MGPRGLVALVTMAMVAGAGGSPSTQGTDAQALLARTGAYVLQFIDGLSNVVAEEQYVQETTTPRRKRSLRSDFLLVRYPGDAVWQAFRDVIEVDGKSVRAEQEPRMLKLFTEPPADALRRAGELARASARYNIVDIGTINNPLVAIAFLQPRYQERFRYTLSGLDRELGPGVRVVGYREFREPTILKGNSNSNVYTTGRVWIQEATGRVVKTELDIGRAPAGVRIATSFAFDEQLGIDVPSEMRDVYPDPTSPIGGVGEVRGVATYRNFRRFEVRTQESLK